MLTPRVLGIVAVLGGVVGFAILQAVPNTCVSTTNGSLTDLATYGEYEGSTQSEDCGTDLTRNYIINAGTTVTWDGSGGPLQGSLETQAGGTLQITGAAELQGTVTNAGTLAVVAGAGASSPTRV